MNGERRYMTELPNASPEDQAWAERIAKTALKTEENRTAPKDNPSWISKEEKLDD